MAEELRKTGIDVIGNVPWATHFCQFYQTKQDLLDILIPYFKAGLENNEFCMWVTAEPLSEREAHRAVTGAIPEFARYEARGQIEILPHDKWYLKDGVFDLHWVLDGWVAKLSQALARGYSGMRVTGNTAWLERSGWKDFTQYEAEINNVIGKYKMLVLCTYSLDRCSASEVIDVVNNHQFALLRKEGRWELIESAVYKQTKEALQQSQHDLSHAQGVAQIGNWRLDVHSNELFWSDETYRIFGIPRETPMTYGTFLAAVHPDDRGYVERKWGAALGGEPYDIEHRIVVADEVKWVREKAELEFDEQRVLKGGFGTVQDITERKEAEQELRETRDYLNNLLDYANAPIIVWDPSFRITRFNHAFERLTGMSSNEAVGKQLEILFPDNRREESMSHIRRAVAGERWEVVEIPILRTDGTVRTVLWNSATLYAADGETVVATIAQGQDITERKQAGREIIELNEALRERAAELEASNKELESFSYSVSHDLREPLRTIDGFSRILQKDYSEKLDAEAQRLIDIIRGGTQRMDLLISNLLSFSRIGRKQMELSEIDMGELAKAVSEELRSAVPERKLRFNIKRLAAARGDPAMVRQVMVNLLANAVKFTGGKRLAVIEVGGLVQGDENVYYVKDNGVGFEPQYRDKLFSIFQRLHSEEEFEGTGVGLAIVQRIVQRHGGHVWAEGKVGCGATFYFTLPGKGGKKQ